MGYSPRLFSPKTESASKGKAQGRLSFWRYDIKAGVADMRTICHKDKLSLNSLYLAAWAHTQAKFCGTDDVTFGLWHSGRSASIPDIDLLAFPCLNILPLRVIIPKGSSLKQIASQIQADLKRRNHDVEQSNLLDIDSWIHGEGKPLCNVFVNILPKRSRKNSADGLLQPVNVVYRPPNALTSYNPSCCNIANLIKVNSIKILRLNYIHTHNTG
jgi:hypothetical protein